MRSGQEVVIVCNQLSLSIEAARLIIVELDITGGDDTNIITSAAEEYLAEEATETDNYSLLIDETLVATAFVRHRYRANLVSPRCTHVDALAVRSDYQRQGYGRALMQHIARQAVTEGDDLISLITYDPEPHRRFGFKTDGKNMHATPAEVLASQPSPKNL